MAIRAVVDTSSLVPFGLRRDLQQAAQLGSFTAIWSPWIIAELNRVLVWRWIDRTKEVSRSNEVHCGEAAKIMMELLLSTFELVAPRPPYPPAWETLTDVWDHPIWAAAKESGANCVISENTHDYPPARADGRHIFEDIEYLSAANFLARLVGEDPLGF